MHPRIIFFAVNGVSLSRGSLPCLEREPDRSHVPMQNRHEPDTLRVCEDICDIVIATPVKRISVERLNPEGG